MGSHAYETYYRDFLDNSRGDDKPAKLYWIRLDDGTSYVGFPRVSYWVNPLNPVFSLIVQDTGQQLRIPFAQLNLARLELTREERREKNLADLDKHITGVTDALRRIAQDGHRPDADCVIRIQTMLNRIGPMTAFLTR